MISNRFSSWIGGVAIVLLVMTAPPSSAQVCAGDCDDSGGVSIAELIRGVRIALGMELVGQCSTLDENSNGNVSIAELIAAVRSALTACGTEPLRTPTPPPTAMPTATSTPGTSDRPALLAQIADEVVLPAVRQFDSDAANLAGAAGAYAARPNATTLTAARAAWRAAMDSFQVLEPMHFGPAGSASMFMGGLGIRDEIYSWPTVNRCAVDQTTVDGDFEDSNFFSSHLVNVYGLDALELLLFREGDDNACSLRIDINRDGTWDALVSSGGLQQRQADYASVVADEIARQATRLRDEWEPSGGNFAAEVRNAGQGGSIYGSAKEALDEVFAAFFFVDTKLKDVKIALPAGINPNCFDSTCPEDVELPFSGDSKRALLKNLDGIEAIFSGAGTSEHGYAGYLRLMGATDLANRMSGRLAASRQSTEAIPGSLQQAVVSDLGAVTDAYAEIQQFTADLKSQFVSILGLTIPQEGAGDND